MDDIDRGVAIASAAPPGVIEFGGRTFVLGRLEEREELGIWQEFRRQVMNDAADPLTVVNREISRAEKAGQPFHPAVINVMVEKALAAAARKEKKAEPSAAEISARMHTFDGGRWLIWFRLRKADPSVTQEWVNEQVPDDLTKDDVLVRMAKAAGLDAIDPKKA